MSNILQKCAKLADEQNKKYSNYHKKREERLLKNVN